MKHDNTVAIIDDDPSIVALVSKILKANGFEVVEAFSGHEGLERVLETKPVVVVLDIMMPEMDGFELCRRIKTNPQLFGTYVILLTALSQEKDVLQGFHCGADDYIIKPFSSQELLARVEAGFKLRQVQMELVDSEKSYSLGLVVGGISHHFNNLLGGIRAYLEMAQIKKDPVFIQTALETAIHNLDSAALIVRNLSYYAGKAYIRRIENVRLDEFVRAFVKFQRKQIEKEGVTIHLELMDAPIVGIDTEAFQNVLSNLLSNACQAIREQGEITFRMYSKDKYLFLEVQDNGTGIVKEDLPYVFDPFFSTKSCQPLLSKPGRGLTGNDIPGHGLGLSVVMGIVNSMDGHIEIQSEAGRGTTVILLFPYPE